MKKTAILFSLLFSLSLHAQNLDSLYQRFIYLVRPGQVSNITGHQVTSDEVKEKCGFGLVNAIKQNLNSYDKVRRAEIQSLLQRPETDTSIVSPSGKFRIHFNTNNFPDYVPEDIRGGLSDTELSQYKRMYLDSLAVAADSSYNYEVNILGYPAPPVDYGEGGGNEIDIYIQNLGYPEYGYTEGDSLLTDSTYTTFIVMDDDFSNYYTKRIDAAKVTIAHEFHHTIQMGNYIFRLKDQFYHEITSVTMEEFVYDSINDYYYELGNFMQFPQKSFGTNSGYNLAIWNLFLSAEFNRDIIKRIWELMRDHERALIANANAIAEKGSSFKIEFAKFGLWVYFTGSRAIPGKYFEEAADYPQLTPLVDMEFTKPQTEVTVTTYPVSTNYLYFNSSGSSVDTFVAVISNCDLSNGINHTISTARFTYTLSSDPGENFRFVTDGYYSNLQSDKDFLFSETDILNYQPINNGAISSQEIDYVYPQPFRNSFDRFIYFPVSANQVGTADLYIYSVDMNLIYSGQTQILVLDKNVVQWNCRDNSGAKLRTGVYLYVLKSGNDVKKGKFVVLND